MTDLIKAVRDYAIDHYDDGKGWDYVVECWTDEDIKEAIGKARTVKGAIKKVGEDVGAVAAYRDEVIATADW